MIVHRSGAELRVFGPKLLTAWSARIADFALSWPIFSKAVDCADLVRSSNLLLMQDYSARSIRTFVMYSGGRRSLKSNFLLLSCGLDNLPQQGFRLRQHRLHGLMGGQGHTGACRPCSCT